MNTIKTYALNERSCGTIIKNRKTSMLFDFKGIEATVCQIAKILDVSPSCVYNRIKKGYAIDGKFRKGRVAKIHTIEGRQMTARDISNAYGINLNKVYNNLRKCANAHTKVEFGMFVRF